MDKVTLIPHDYEGFHDEDLEPMASQSSLQMAIDGEDDYKPSRELVGFFVFTSILVISAPIIQHYENEAWAYILAAGLAFTIGTNAMIGYTTVVVESKADRMEKRIIHLLHFIEELLGSLEKTAETMDNFSEQIDVADIPGMVQRFEEAKDVLAPALSRFEGIQLQEIAEFSVQALDFAERVDTDKLNNLVGGFIKPKADTQSESEMLASLIELE